jgi:hypothetical protein
MTGRDAAYFRRCYGRGLVRGPFLDIGSMKVNEVLENLRDPALSLGAGPPGEADASAPLREPRA